MKASQEFFRAHVSINVHSSIKMHSDMLGKEKQSKGHLQTMLTLFSPLLTTYPPPVDFFEEISKIRENLHTLH